VVAEDGTVISKMTQFLGEFYERFFTVNPSGKRLFENKGLHVQGRALVKMMALIVKGIDDHQLITNTLFMLGGRHVIYGVDPADFTAFSNAMCDTVASVVGRTICTPEARDAWFKVLMEISAMMQDAGKKIQNSLVRGSVWRKVGRNSKWKKSDIATSLDTLFVYKKSTDPNKLRCTFLLKDVHEVEITPEQVQQPTQFGFYLDLSGGFDNCYFGVETRLERVQWMEQIQWRTAALQRVFKDSIAEASEDGNTNVLGKSFKKQKC